METATKQRLIGAAVLLALAVIFLPMLVQGPAPDSGVSDVSLAVPDAPRDDATTDLPLVTPDAAPQGGALGMPAQQPADATGSIDAPADSAGMLPASVAGGDYAVHFGSYATAADARIVAGQLTGAKLPAYVEATTLNGKPAWRVRVGPYATQADAETSRLRAVQVRDDVGAKVITLDAVASAPSTNAVTTTPAPAASTAAATTQALPAPKPDAKPADPKQAAATTATAKPAQDAAASKSATPVVAKSVPAPAATPAATSTAPAPKPAPPAEKPANAPNTGFAVQLGAFSNVEEANKLRDRVRAAGMSAFVQQVKTDKGTLSRVRVGPVVSRAEADALQQQLRSKVGVDGIVRPHP